MKIYGFSGNQFRMEEVITISPAEKKCYPRGADITGAISGVNHETGLHEGQLLWLYSNAPESPVYVVSEGKLRHLNVSGDALPSLGYDWARVSIVSKPLTADADLTMDDFTTCPNQLTVSSPPPGVNLGRTVVPNTDPKYFGLDPLVVFYHNPSDPMRRPTILVGYDQGIRAFRYDASFLWETHDAWDNLELSDVKVDFSPRL